MLLAGLLALGTYLPAGIEYKRSELIETYQASIPDKIRHYGADTKPEIVEIALAIARAESNYRNVCNTEGCRYGRGIFQIVQSTFDEQCPEFSNVMDVDENIQCAYKMLEKGEYWRWKQSQHIWMKYISKSLAQKISVLCDCMEGLRTYGIDFNGKAKDLPIGDRPVIGGVAKFYYNNVGTYHGAKIVGFWNEGIIVDDTNYDPCKETRGRKVRWDNKSLLGFSIL